ncbi:hypothetical protein [Planotetraspora kaengkrachanensis]|uniref:Uncharacterized protein n=1 Tax=Planotetraspora kaengkrachanensis TaxID=575193 RepID=A0A8J3M1H5_9ACTN|nr:hypothetical protein [Planotetraspora kaengkrachanensis]GIG80428.1 hypothetical protein Pka01_35550 [Planotetraspora kaengkrachanensis]
MGFWGSIVVARLDVPLTGLRALKGYDGHAKELERSADGWRIWELSVDDSLPDPEDLVVGVSEETGAPALVGFVMDSDCVAVAAFSRSARSWSACLAPNSMAAYLRPDDLKLSDLFLPPEEAAVLAVRWAADAGYRVSPVPIVELLNREGAPYAEHLFAEFIERVGIALSPGAG